MTAMRPAAGTCFPKIAAQVLWFAAFHLVACAASREPARAGSASAQVAVAASGDPDGGEGAKAEEVPARSAEEPETLERPADCSTWRSERGRLPRQPAFQCAGPALDSHTSTRDREALKEVTDAVAWKDTVPPMSTIIAQLLGVSDACEDQCSPQIQSKAWMYAGITFGSGMNDLVGAQCSFEVALAWDPKVRLDKDISTKGTKAAFATARRTVCDR